MPRVREPAIVGESNGHHWFKALWFQSCRDCGMIRRTDDQNKPCRGVVRVGPRAKA